MTFPSHFGEGEGQGDGGVPLRGATAPSGSAAPRGAPVGEAVPPGPAARTSGDSGHFDPDPAPLVTARAWEYDLRYARGALSVAGVRPVDLPKPVPTVRRMGRFALELRVGPVLVERVRFDFPLLAADSPPEGPKRPLHAEPRFSPGAETSVRVLLPREDRSTSAAVIDRLTGDVVKLPWPPRP